MKQKTIQLLIFLLACGLLVGCGGGDDEESSIAKAEFVKKVNAKCQVYRRDMGNELAIILRRTLAGKPAGNGPTTEEVVADGLEKEIAAMEALGMPSDGEEQVEELMATMQTIVDRAKSNPGQFQRTAGRLYIEAQNSAIEYGLDACGSPARLRIPNWPANRSSSG